MLCSGVVRRCKSEDGGMNCRGDSEVTRPESGNGETRRWKGKGAAWSGAEGASSLSDDCSEVIESST